MAGRHGEEDDTMLKRYRAVDASLLTSVADSIFNGTAPAVLIYRPRELEPETN